MEMHKIEVYTQQKELTRLLGNLPGEANLVGALDVHFQQRNLRSGENLAADTRIEIFTETDPAEVMAQLSTLDAVFDIQSYPCQPLLTDVKAAEPTPPPSDPAVQPYAVQPHVTRISAPASCRISEVSDNTTRITAQSSVDSLFLHKLFHLIAAREMSLTGGRKYRQGDKDFAILTTTAPVIGSSQGLQADITDILENVGSPLHLPTAIHVACDEIAVRLDAGSSLPALIVRAAGDTALIRQSLQALFSRYALDVVIARFTLRENGIEDIYYLKQLGDTAVTEQLARFFEQTLSGGK